MQKIKLKNVNIKDKKYKLVRGVSGLLIPIVFIGGLTGCIDPKETFEYGNKSSFSSKYDYNISDDVTSYNNITPSSSTVSIPTSSSPSSYNNQTTPSYELDELSKKIIDSNISINTNSLKQYIDGIKVDYPYSELYDSENILKKYESLKTYKSTFPSLFSGNSISSSTIYNIVKRNNSKANFDSIYVMNDSDIKNICEIIANLLNDFVKNNKNLDLNLLSEKINDLKIIQTEGFSNGSFDSKTCKLAISKSLLSNKGSKKYKETIQHEMIHFIQSNSIKESNLLNIDARYGPCYKFYNEDINSLFWNWYFEGSAEYLTCDYNNHKSPNEYQNQIKSIDTIKYATIFNKGIDFEKLTLSNDLNDFFNYFNCKTKEDKIEILNMMYAYTIKFDVSLIADKFYDKYSELNNESLSYLKTRKKINNSIGQTLTKQFYSGLANQINSKNINVSEIFSMICVFEKELNQEILYSTDYYELDAFFDTYTGIQLTLFEAMGKKLNLSSDEVKHAYNVYAKNLFGYEVQMNMLNSEQKDMYNYLLNQKRSTTLFIINIFSEVLGKSKQK